MRKAHHPILADNNTFDVSHLNSFQTILAGKGREPNSDLCFEVEISCHVYTKRSTPLGATDITDHNGNPRKFCNNRYNLSLRLPQLVQQAIQEDTHSFKINDYNQISNLALFNLDSGFNYYVVYCFEPSKVEEYDIKMCILSAYSKTAPKKRKGNKLSYYARKSLFNNCRIP